MVKKDALKKRLSELEELRRDSISSESRQQIKSALEDKSSFVVARAAEIIAEYQIDQLEDALIAAFERFRQDPVNSDPGCSAKTALIEALYRTGCHREGPFLHGIRHVQLEPVYGGKQDTAAKLRAFSALGLVRTLYPDIMIILADLLADPELDARLGAVRAIASSSQNACVPLLRFKALTGDSDLRVLDECFRSLLEIDPDSSLSFVAGFLDSEDEALGEAAALALGESRLESALDPLQDWCQNLLRSPRLYTGLTAIALLRTEESLDYLVSLVTGAPVSAARQAVSVLNLYRDDPVVWQKVENAVARRSDLKL